MTTKKKTILISTLSVIGLIILIVLSLSWSHRNVNDLTKWHNAKMSPVIMVPGSSASINRFDRLVGELNHNRKNPHSLLKVKVTENGKLQYFGKIRPDDTEPIIVVGFENNHDGYSNIKKQARWFNIAFQDLSQKYNFNNFKAIGHSNGGLIYTYFLEHYYSRYQRTERLKRLMMIGSPYNFNEKSMNHQTKMLADFIKYRKDLPKNISVYLVAGTQTYISDGLVPVNSVLVGRYIYQNQVKHFTTIMVSGENAQHSDLPQNTQIVDLINRYILDHKQKIRRQQNTPYINDQAQ
ncbi:alpha/beta hydrolase [Limosilactobacillus sp. RRLNB_1_1]|uniref:Alpha/beta hydrolase n=1 Tax=Limosilactobacillus albertensis TaxID=2759752 RepID=A0A7W3Y8Y1_9LACO|nr:alpha/beta hydrolase [Limosilactobacillus albertensis]MBB1069942.1 alpha/beta hydrolase [Limosilactobacillus albertensis]MCD7117179.1 alpha/beta hydrolase [Limosilactobacillus albertensis]MCD7128783.1 alpha/beta hydrolase [Limosilactobacillus albertensis]